MRLLKDKWLWRCVLINLIIAAAIFVPYIVRGGGAFSLHADFNEQQIPFTMAAQRAIRSGGLDSWVNSMDLGSSNIEAFSFYEIGSPFFWLTMLFPEQAVPYLIGWIYILKYVVAGVLMYVFLRRFTKKPLSAIIGGVLYAFSGFQTTNLMFYHFHDVVAFFPLLLIGLERFMADRKAKKLFVFAVFLNCTVNYFFFIQEIVFLVIYYLFRFWKKDKRRMFFDACRCALLAGWGIAMAAAIFLPNMFYITGNPRASGVLSPSKLLLFPRSSIELIAKGILLPAESMRDHSLGMVENYDSIACWLPLVGLVPVIAYILKKPKKWLSLLIVFLLLCSFVPFLSGMFLLMKAIYMRWWYMLIAVMVLAVAIVLDEPKKYPIAKAAIVNITLVVLFVAFELLFGKVIYHGLRLVIYAAVVSIMYLTTWFLIQREHWRMFIVLLGISCMASSSYVIFCYQDKGGPTADYMAWLTRHYSLSYNDARYRFNTPYNIDTLPNNIPGLSSFSSTVSNAIRRFDKSFDHTITTYRIDKNTYPGLVELLGGRYSFKGDEIVEREVCPIGFAVKKYLTMDELMANPVEKRGLLLLNGAAVENATDISGLEHLDAASVDEESIGAAVKTCQENAVASIANTPHGYEVTSDYENDEWLYFAIPNEKGWTITIDGEKAEIIDSNGMILIHVPAGKHEIVFRFSTPGFAASSLVSLVSWVGFCGYAVACDKKRRK